MLPEPTFNSYLMLSAVLMVIGAAGVFLRRSLVTILLSVEVMLAGVTLTLVAADRYLGRVDGQVLAGAMILASLCHLGIGLAVAVVFVRERESLDPDEVVEPRV